MNTIIHNFDRITAAYADSKALAFGAQQYTYSQLQVITDVLIQKFAANGIESNQLVAVHMHDPLLNISVILALYRMGCGYLPLDPAYPEQRIKYMAEHAGVRRVICDTELALDKIEQIKLQRSELDNVTASEASAITHSNQPDLGYVIYTSGSTGKPKGVEMSRQALDNLIDWQLAQPGFDQPARTAQFSATSFDVSFQEIFTTLCSGGCLYLIDSQVKKDFRSLLNFIIEHKIERIFMPYIALLNLVQWANRLESWPDSLVHVITAGESLLIDQGMQQFFDRTGAALYNQYGPTESHVVTQYKMADDVLTWPSSPPIGSVINNAGIYLLDQQQTRVADGAEGEIYITGQCLANGYINNDSESKKKFITLDLEGVQTRAYRTGDQGKWNSAGDLIFLGRADNQIKISGHRIELAEVEASLLDLPEVEAAAIAVQGSNSGDKSLLGFIISQADQINRADIKRALKDRIPEYMVPQTIVLVDEFVRTPSGKIDRKKMLEDYLQSLSKAKAPSEDADAGLPITEILAILADELKVEAISVEQNLIDLGMDSLASNRIVARFYDDLTLDMPAYRLFQYNSVGDLLSALDKTDAVNMVKVKTQAESGSAGQSHDIAIVGMAVNVPGANTLEQFWANLSAGKESLSGESQTAEGKVSKRGLLQQPLGFDAAFFNITPAEAEFIDPQQRIMLMLAWHALEDAGCVADEFAGRIGVFCGTGNNTYYLNNVLKNTTKVDEYGSLQAMVANEKDYTATRISHKLNLKGPSLNIQTACSTSLVSVCEAVKSLRSGDCDLAIAGGAAVSFPQSAPYDYQEGGIFSKDGHTRAFANDSSGTVFSDGGGMVILKRLDYALNDNDTIYAVITGAAVNNDGADKGSFSAPSIEGQQNAIYAAHIDANISADQVNYIEAHGTATPMGDPIEVEALSKAFGLSTDKKQFCGLGSVKSNIGHLTAGSGVIGMIKSALSLKHALVPPTINFNEVNPALNITKTPFFIAEKAVELDAEANNFIGISSFGIGGTNAHVVLKSHQSALSPVTHKPALIPLCISTKQPAVLRDYMQSYKSWLDTQTQTSFSDIAHSALHQRKAFKYRVSIAATDVDGALSEINKKLKGNAKPTTFTAKNIVFLFPGQGTQTLQMGQYLYAECETFRGYFDQCAQLLSSDHSIDIKAIIASGDEQLEKTEYAQVALFTICFALAKSLQALKINPTHMLGHSIGELSCAVIAGVFSLEDALEVVVTRGRVMQDQPPGDMIAVMCDAQSLQKFTNQQVVLAADNSADACTLSGSAKAINNTMVQLDKAGISYKPLKTSHAFHSPLMQGAVNAFTKTLAHIQCQAPQRPFISCVTGDWITPEQAMDISYWAQQIISTVNFRKGVTQLATLDNLLLIEAGPRKTMAGLCLQNLADKEDCRIVNLLPEAGKENKEVTGFISALGQIWEASVDIDWSPLVAENEHQFSGLPTYPFQLKDFLIEPEQPQFEQQQVQLSALAINPNIVLPTQAVPVPVLQQAPSPIAVEPNMSNSILEQLKTLFADASGLDLSDADASANFFELGLDSLFLTQASLSIKKKFKMAVTFRQLLNECNSFSKLETFLIDAGLTIEPEPVVAETPAVAPQVAAQAPLQMPLSSPAQPTIQSTMQTPMDVNTLLMQQMQLINSQMQILNLSMTQANVAAPAQVVPVPAPAAQPQVAPAVADTDSSKPKPFGASVRINAKRSNELTADQSEHLQNVISRYTKRLSKSKAFAQSNRKQLADPRVVSGFRTPLKELIFPIVVERSQGANLWDIDGNRYVDITCGFGSNFFGNGAEFIKTAIAEQLEIGYEIGPQNPLVEDVSKMFCELTNSDRVAFCNTGSEAVLGAIRLARTVTAKDKIVMFENDYHGINDEVIVTRGNSGLPLPAAAGVPAEHISNTIILDYGSASSLEYIRENVDEIAAVVVEPVQSRHPDLQPREFLQELRTICSDSDMALVFDEVITGLRIHQNGAQGYFGIQSDIATYGKIIGGGLPIGVIAGKSEYLDALDGGYWEFGDDSAPEVGVTYFAGTFVRHPLAMAAAKAVLLHLRENPTLQDDMNAKAERMVNEINEYCQQVGAPIKVPHCGSLFKIKISQDITYEELIYVLLRDKGIHIWDGRPCFITTAHTDEDIRFFINAFKQSVDEMLNMGFLPRGKKAKDEAGMVFDAKTPPVPGARLGKKPNGEPAWFVENPDKPGKYEMLTYQ